MYNTQLKVANWSIVFQEIPNETTLALNISNCPINCPGCHSPWLRDDIGTPLTKDFLKELIKTYSGEITCVAFMGGDLEPWTINELAKFVQSLGLKPAWYSGLQELTLFTNIDNFSYIKLGPYIEKLGPLKSSTTNQALYAIIDGKMHRIRMYN